ncbi:DUF790 family protein [Halobaculum sp. MBLA0147]|uniref:DUF790 family protein n=1 Tax=Halobaculum sp. MBLA0147 TaxID=3079934 RepID=UPI0035251FAB
MLTKDLRRISRAGGGYHPQFVGDDDEARRLAARVIGVYQGHVGERRRDLEEALETVERETDDFKLVRGFAKLLERSATFETRAPLPPDRVRRAVFEAAESVGVTDETERREALADAADGLGTEPETVERSLYADRDAEQVLADLDADPTPASLCVRYDFALAAASLLDATEVRLRSSDPAALVSAVKRNGLLYEVYDTSESASESGATGDSADATLSTREVVVTGPDALFRRTRRYGTAFADLLRTVARTATRWELTATVDDRGRERTLELSDADVPVPSGDPTGEPAFDSGVESAFAARFRALEVDWTLVREPEPLRVDGPDGETRVAVPDFAFVYDHADFRLFFEVMGFWTPEYVEKKLAQFRGLEDVALLVAVDASLGVGEAVAATGAEVIEYDGTVRPKPVVDVLRRYETDLRETATADLPAELVPDADAVGVATLAAEYGVPESALDDVSLPDHERVGDTFVRPAVLERVRDRLEPGMEFETASEWLADAGVPDANAALTRLGYRVAWEGLGGGTLERVADDGGE